MNPLTYEQKKQIESWLAERKALRCRVCDMGNLLAPSEVVTLPGSNDKPLIRLTCDFCANVVFFDAKMMGVLR
jgi:hypothetical protein